MTDLIDTTEMYLRTIFELLEDGVPPLRARIAEQLGHAGPTVSQTIARMERDGLVVVEGDRTLRLTDEGLARATRVMRKHRLAERLLTDVIGLPLAEVHDEACRWEHVMSERVERRLVEMLDHPRTSPYGNSIPGLIELCDIHETGTEVPVGVLSMADFLDSGGTELHSFEDRRSTSSTRRLPRRCGRNWSSTWGFSPGGEDVRRGEDRDRTWRHRD